MINEFKKQLCNNIVAFFYWVNDEVICRRKLNTFFFNGNFIRKFTLVFNT